MKDTQNLKKIAHHLPTQSGDGQYFGIVQKSLI